MHEQRDNPTRSTDGGSSGRVLGTAFFLAFALGGAFFTYAMLGDFYQRATSWFWDETPCAIESIEIRDDYPEHEPYSLHVVYDYEFEGASYRSQRWTIGESTTSNYGDLHEVVALDRDGACVCFVNPDEPTQAILDKPSLWLILFFPIPLLFLGIGGAGLWGMWFGSDVEEQSISRKASLARKARPIGRAVLLALFAGASLLCFWTGQLAYEQWSASKRQETRCEIVHSRLLSQDSSEGGTTYALDILYEFELDGVTYRSNRYDVMGALFSSGSGGKREILRQYPTGSSAVCYVDPERPYAALLSARWRPLHGLLVLPFAGWLLIGWGCRRTFRHRRVEQPEARPVGPLRLEPKQTPLSKLVGLTLFSVIWFGFCAFLVYQSTRDRADWVLWLITGAFCFFGLLLLFGIVHTMLSAFNPRVVLELAQPTLRPGAACPIQWSIHGNPSVLQSLSVRLVGREEAVYTRGTDTVTDTHVFFEETLTHLDHSPPRGGSIEVRIPEGAMHSFRARHNRIVWELKVDAPIARWPDLEQAYPVLVAPAYEQMPSWRG